MDNVLKIIVNNSNVYQEKLSMELNVWDVPAAHWCTVCDKVRHSGNAFVLRQRLRNSELQPWSAPGEVLGGCGRWWRNEQLQRGRNTGIVKSRNGFFGAVISASFHYMLWTAGEKTPSTTTDEFLELPGMRYHTE